VFERALHSRHLEGCIRVVKGKGHWYGQAVRSFSLQTQIAMVVYGVSCRSRYTALPRAVVSTNLDILTEHMPTLGA